MSSSAPSLFYGSDAPADVQIDLPGTTQLIAEASEQFPRHSEADVIELTDGRLLAVWAAKTDGEDHAPGNIMCRYSADRGQTWSAQQLFQPVWGDVIDVMSVSFCRSDAGIHFFFLGRTPVAAKDGKSQPDTLQVYQRISYDEGATWSEPAVVSRHVGFNVLNNARVIRTNTGRLLAPISFVPGDIHALYNQQTVHCIYSDDNGNTWHASNELKIEGTPLMEPGVAQCADGSIYMAIRTKTGFLYYSRSHDNGTTWSAPASSGLASAEAPATVVRDPKTNNLWMFWCAQDYNGKWYSRHTVAVAVSQDSGRTWGKPHRVEYNPAHSFGYVSVLFMPTEVLLSYYDWKLSGTTIFHMTHLRQRSIPRAWLDERLSK